MRNVLILGQPRTGSSRIAYLCNGNRHSVGVLEPLGKGGDLKSKMEFLLDPNSDGLNVTKILVANLAHIENSFEFLNRLALLYRHVILTTRDNSLEKCLSFSISVRTDTWNGLDLHRPCVALSRKDIADYAWQAQRSEDLEAHALLRLNAQVVRYEDHEFLSSEETAALYSLPGYISGPEVITKIDSGRCKISNVTNMEEVLGWFERITYRPWFKKIL